MEEQTKMGNIKEQAMAYEPPKTLNISNLDKISVELDLEDGEGKDKKGEPFKYKYIKVDGQEYRVPGIVLGHLKAILTKMPNLTHFSVLKTGEGLGTTYQVLPITDAAQTV